MTITIVQSWLSSFITNFQLNYISSHATLMKQTLAYKEGSLLCVNKTNVKTEAKSNIRNQMSKVASKEQKETRIKHTKVMITNIEATTT